MAYCANCGQAISDLAEACPKCGHPHVGDRPVLELADFWMRFLAYFLDSLILAVPGFLIGLLMAAGQIGMGAIGDGQFRGFGPFFSLNPVGYVVGFVYHWLMIALNNGQTIGKKVCSIRILNADGTPVELGQAAGRAGMAIVSGIPLALGYLWAAWDPERRTWHDMVVNTRAFKVY